MLVFLPFVFGEYSVVHTVEQAFPQFEEINEGQIGARLHEFG